MNHNIIFNKEFEGKATITTGIVADHQYITNQTESWSGYFSLFSLLVGEEATEEVAGSKMGKHMAAIMSQALTDSVTETHLQ